MHSSRRAVQFIAALATVLSLAAARPGAAWSETCGKASASPPLTLRAIPSRAAHPPWQAPRIRNRNGTSTNWSGYAFYGTPNSSGKGKGKPAPGATFSDVKGSWVIPTVVASDSADTYSAAWIGLDGYSTNTVEQIGTDQDWSGGSPQYYAWFEMYPKGAYEIVGFPVNPGDTISAEVKYTSKGAFTLTITNVTEDVTYVTTQRLQSAQRLSAEWIMEAPWWGGVLPLADFGEIGFSDCSATTSGGPWQSDQITMAASDGTVKALPSDWSQDGFSVTWEHE